MRIMDIVKEVKPKEFENENGKGHACISNELEGMEWIRFKSRLNDEFGIECIQVAKEVPNIILYYPNYYSAETVNDLLKIYKDRLKELYPDRFEEENKKVEKKRQLELEEDEDER